MKTDILTELQFLPSLYYFSLTSKYHRLIIEGEENYNKGSFRNRAVIKSNAGRQTLTIPLRKGKNDNALIRTVQIADDENWIKPMLHTLQTEYGKLPYFEIYFEELKELFCSKPHLYLFSLNQILLEWILSSLQLEIPKVSVQFDPVPDESIADFRDEIRPGFFKRTPTLFTSHHLEYFHFTPAHSILEVLFSYGPETQRLIQIYGRTLEPSLTPAGSSK